VTAGSAATLERIDRVADAIVEVTARLIDDFEVARRAARAAIEAITSWSAGADRTESATARGWPATRDGCGDNRKTGAARFVPGGPPPFTFAMSSFRPQIRIWRSLSPLPDLLIERIRKARWKLLGTW
jgi:hypothetical protein